jgi:hypothetical protein
MNGARLLIEADQVLDGRGGSVRHWSKGAR